MRAVYPRAENAWLLGTAAKKSEDLVLVGARGLNPASTKCRIVAPAEVILALAAGGTELV